MSLVLAQKKEGMGMDNLSETQLVILRLHGISVHRLYVYFAQHGFYTEFLY